MNNRASNFGLSYIDLAVDDRVIQRVLSEEPVTIAIFVRGSYAYGTADRSSNFDLAALTTAKPIGSHQTWIEPTTIGLLHVSISVRQIDEWVAARIGTAGWSPSLATQGLIACLYEANGDARSRLGDSPVEFGLQVLQNWRTCRIRHESASGG